MLKILQNYDITSWQLAFTAVKMHSILSVELMIEYEYSYN